MKNKNLIWWIVGILFIIFVVPKLSIHFPFAIVTETVCANGVEDYYSLDGNLLDSKGNLDIINHGAVFVSGKMGQGLYFNRTTYITFPNFSSNLNVGYWKNEGTGWIYVSGPVSSLNGFLGFNGSVDEIVIGTNITGLENIQPCYTRTSYENVSCQEYVLSQVPTLSSGCINLQGDMFPNCSYIVENLTKYKLANNKCEKVFYCSEGMEFNTCNSSIQVQQTSQTSPSGTVTSTIPTEEQKGWATKEIFKLFGISITVIHLFLALLLIIGILYLLGVFGKK